MATSLEVLFSPAEFEALKHRDLTQAVCVVFDVLRATSTMVSALANGAAAIIPVATIPEALEVRRRQPEVLLGGERDGVRIEGKLSGGISFDLGNSPREFTRDKVARKTVVMTTTNGTRALRACVQARTVLVGSFLNLRAVGETLEKNGPTQLLIVCSGTFEEAAYEDVLGAGALCDLIWPLYRSGRVADSALVARRLYQLDADNLLAAVSGSHNGRRLMARAALREDVPFCLQRDRWEIVAEMDKAGVITRCQGA